MSTSDREGSPEAASPTASAAYLRETRASMCRSAKSKSRPSDVGSPEPIEQLAKVPAMDRIKMEHSAYLQQRYSNSRGPAAFGGTRQGSAKPNSPQAKRREANERRAEQARAELAQKHGESSSPKKSGSDAPRKEGGSSWWAKSDASSSRHGFQRVWPGRGYPHAAVQESMRNAAPGPGAYGKSRSHLVPS